MSLIPTQRPSLSVTLRAIAVCGWAIVSDAAHGVAATTAALWRDHRATSAAWQAQHDAVQRAYALTTAHDGDDALADEAIAELAQQPYDFPPPRWLLPAVLAVVCGVLVIDLWDAWPLLFDALGLQP